MKEYAEKFMEMCDLQAETDRMIFEKMRMLSVPAIERYVFAIVDEVGELNHELKPQWCWWKEKPGDVNRDKALVELVDIWHFCLSLMIHHSSVKLEDIAEGLNYELRSFYSPAALLANIGSGFVGKLQLQAVFEQLIGWGNNFGFDFPTVYEAYKKKNEENNARAKSNY